MAATSGKSTHLQTSMPADYVKELQDEELHSLGVHMLATRSNGDDTTRPRLSVWVWCEAEKNSDCSIGTTDAQERCRREVLRGGGNVWQSMLVS